MMRNFIRDIGNQMTLGVFVATFGLLHLVAHSAAPSPNRFLARAHAVRPDSGPARWPVSAALRQGRRHGDRSVPSAPHSGRGSGADRGHLRK
jgi:hypothetical protein